MVLYRKPHTMGENVYKPYIFRELAPRVYEEILQLNKNTSNTI
jgi:hypothetical protein